MAGVVKRRWAYSIALAAALVSLMACSGLPGITAAPAADEAEQPGPGQPGTLAIVGTDGNIYLHEIGGEPQPITIDAETPGGPAYSDPSWSPAGWLSYVGVTRSGDQAEVSIYALAPGSVEPLTVQTASSGYVYGYWSPAPCEGPPDCARFAYLLSPGREVELNMATVSSDPTAAPQTHTLSRSAQHYYSWSPDGENMLWLRDGSELAVYSVADDAILERFSDEMGRFQAPVWSPVDNRWLYARAAGRSSQITVRSGSERLTIGSSLAGMAHFGWSPDGTYVAYGAGSSTIDRLVIARADGSSETVVQGLGSIVAFFWSPDSTRLAAVTIEEPEPDLQQAASGVQARPALQGEAPHLVFVWYSIDAASGESVRLAEFVPTDQQLYILQFFDQYAQSHRVWSADSRYIVYAEKRLEAPSWVRLIDTQNPDDTPAEVMQGVQAIFSFAPAG
ncbi:MAG: PD40 domain-containing protein [Anaerolineae bacterium]